MTQPDELAGPPWTTPPPARPDPEIRQRIRELRAQGRRLLAVLDDDPTGSQAVHDMQVVTVTDPDEYRSALAGEGGRCFILTNSRSLGRSDAVALNKRVAGDLWQLASERGAELDLVSRSDSTLRGHVFAEVTALNETRRDRLGSGYDGVLFAPAFVEAGRVTTDDTHWAKVGDRFRPVAETEFAQDATFGFGHSDLAQFLAEASGGVVRSEDVHRLSLVDLRVGGPERVAEILGDVTGFGFVVVNALSYDDLYIAVLGALLAEQRGRSFLYRSGPSLVRSLAGQGPGVPLSPARIWAGLATDHHRDHGLVVVGSHVGQTSRQIEALQANQPLTEVVVDVPRLLALDRPGARAGYLDELATQVTSAIRTTDVLLYTSRSLVTGSDGEASLGIGREVSAAVADIVRQSLSGQVSWVVAKGGITSHDVAVRGLGIRRSQVIGQLFPGMVSVFRPIDADPRAVGRPFVVFAGNVGDSGALAEVVRRMHADRSAVAEEITA